MKSTMMDDSWNKRKRDNLIIWHISIQKIRWMFNIHLHNLWPNKDKGGFYLSQVPCTKLPTLNFLSSSDRRCSLIKTVTASLQICHNLPLLYHLTSSIPMPGVKACVLALDKHDCKISGIYHIFHLLLPVVLQALL